MNLGDPLRTAIELIEGPRQEAYGDPAVNFARFADLVNAQFDTTFSPGDMAVVMALSKIARSAHEKKLDSFVDAPGYLGIAAYLYNEEGRLTGVPVSTPPKRQRGVKPPG